MSEFASKWPDMTLWATVRARTVLGSGVKVSAERNEKMAKQVVVSAIPAQMETPVSRAFLVTAECWSSNSKSAALNLATDTAYALETAPRDADPVVRAEPNAGPQWDRDDAGVYYATVTVLVVAHRS